MNESGSNESSRSSTTDEGKEKFARGVYIYTGPQTIADSKMRLAEWLERRGW